MFDIQVFVMVLLFDGLLLYSFKWLLIDLEILFDEDIFYNGGNDVYYIMEVFFVFIGLQKQDFGVFVVLYIFCKL